MVSENVLTNQRKWISVSTINISQAQIPEGESEWVEIDVGVDSDLSTVTLHLYVINGEREGPTLWLQGGIHGNEQGGSLAVETSPSSSIPARFRER